MQIVDTKTLAIYSKQGNPKWVRKATGKLKTDMVKTFDYPPRETIEIAVSLLVNLGGFSPVDGVAVDIGEDADGNTPVSVYYYAILDGGRTHAPMLSAKRMHADEEIVDMPEWM